MGKIHEPVPVKLFVGVLSSISRLIPEVEEELTRIFGPSDSRSESFPFDFSSYYYRQMGAPIQRHFFSFRELVSPEAIAEIKVKTNDMEGSFSAKYQEVKRPVNLDPGYLDLAKIVLASTKDFYHRILLSKGIYAEVTMHYESGEWRSFPWTFPDFRSGRYSSYFSALRRDYRLQLKSQKV